MKSIIQHGIDGFGHQLHGLFSCLILHGINNFNFAGYEYIKKSFRFDHINEEETKIQKEYLIEVAKLFIIKYNISPMKYKTYIHSHEVYNIPKIYDINTLYSLDNAYYFNRINLNNDEQIKHLENIISMKELFINKYLPKNRLIHNNIVIHIRLGDAMTTGRGDSITKYNERILELLHIFYIKYPNYKSYKIWI